MKDFLYSLPLHLKQIWEGAKQIKRLNLSLLRKVFSLMGKTEKILILALLALSIAAFLWSARNLYYAATLPAPGHGGSYTEGFVGQPNYINPVLAFSENDLSLVRLVYSGLYKYGAKGDLLPDLAESLPQISEDQKQYTVKIKNNIQWHNGKNLIADDIIFTILTIKDPDFKSPLRGAWVSTNAEKIDDLTVKFTTKEVSGPFINNLTVPILPQDLWANVQAKNFPLSEMNLKAIGSGPFAVKEIKKLTSGKIQSITLGSFANFYSKAANLDEITIKFYDDTQDLLNALHSRDIGGFGFIPFDKNIYLDKERENVQILKLPLPQYQALFFNYRSKNLSDTRMRSALNELIPRADLIEKALGNNARTAVSIFNFYSDPQNNKSPEPNLEKAKNLLEAAGWKKNSQNNKWEKNGQPLEFRLFTNDFLPNARAAENLSENFRNFGVNISLNVLPGKQLTENHIKPRDFDLLLYGQKFGADPDPFAFWHSSQTKDPGLNLSGFEDAEADKLITSARTTTDKELRQEKYEQLNGLLKDRLPAAFLTQSVYTYALDKNIHGVSLTKLYDIPGRFYDAVNWYVMEKRVWK